MRKSSYGKVDGGCPSRETAIRGAQCCERMGGGAGGPHMGGQNSLHYQQGLEQVTDLDSHTRAKLARKQGPTLSLG